MATSANVPPPTLACPACPKCGAGMLLVSIIPNKRSGDQRIYDCPRCQHEVTEFVQFQKVS